MKLPERDLETKLRSIFDLRALCMSLHDAWLEQRESKFFALFERLKREPLPKYSAEVLEGLRYTFRMTWAKNDFKSIVRAGENLPQEILQQEPLLAAYLHHAREMLD